MSLGGLIERDSERDWLEERLAAAVDGRGSLVLLTGDAGVGKTRFAEAVARDSEAQLLRGTPGPGAVAYGPVVSALRGYLHADGTRELRCGALSGHLALLLPELGEAVDDTDRAT